MAASPAEPAKPKSSKSPLNFKQQYELKTLPERIATLEAEISAQQVLLEDPSFYMREPELFDKTVRGLAAKQQELDAAMQRWLELETLAPETSA